LRSKSIELGEGYSISVNYDEDGLPKIRSECQPTIEVSAKPKLKRRKERLKRRKNERKKRRKV